MKIQNLIVNHEHSSHLEGLGGRGGGGGGVDRFWKIVKQRGGGQLEKLKF